MGMVVEEGGPCFHSGLTTCTHSSSRDLTLTPMRMPMPMPTTTSTSTTTSTRYRLPGTLIASPPPTIISRITTVIIITIIRITITIIVIIITIITITTITIIRFKSISISPEISVIETPVSVCKVTRLPERCSPRNAPLYFLLSLFWPARSFTCRLRTNFTEFIFHTLLFLVSLFLRSFSFRFFACRDTISVCMPPSLLNFARFQVWCTYTELGSNRGTAGRRTSSCKNKSKIWYTSFGCFRLHFGFIFAQRIIPWSVAPRFCPTLRKVCNKKWNKM